MKPVFVLITLLACIFSVSAQETLSPTGTNHLIWPFPNSEYVSQSSGTNNWYVSCPSGCGSHLGGDYYADDWSLPGSADCGLIRFAPLAGTVIFAGTGQETGYGNQVVIQSDLNPDFAWRTAHLSSWSVTLGQKVKAGDEIGQIETTGSSTGCHAHEVLYKNINKIYSGSETALSRLKKGLGLGFTGSATQFAAPYFYDAKKAATVTSVWTIKTQDGLYNGTLDLFKIWKLANANGYSVTVTIQGLPSGSKWTMYIETENGVKAYSVTIYMNNTAQTATFSFQVPSDFVYSGNQRYRFRIVSGTSFDNVLTESPVFYMGDIPSLAVSSLPGSVSPGQNVPLSWAISGGLPTLGGNGWSGNVLIQLYQGGSYISELATPQAATGSYSLTVPASLSPGSYQLHYTNGTGSSLPYGIISVFTPAFTVKSGPTGISDGKGDSEQPAGFSLKAYPNPFNPATTLALFLKEPGFVTLTVYDINGKEQLRLINNTLTAGTHEYPLQLGGASGVYFIKAEVNGIVQKPVKLVLLK